MTARSVRLKLSCGPVVPRAFVEGPLMGEWRAFNTGRLDTRRLGAVAVLKLVVLSLVLLGPVSAEAQTRSDNPSNYEAEIQVRAKHEEMKNPKPIELPSGQVETERDQKHRSIHGNLPKVALPPNARPCVVCD